MRTTRTVALLLLAAMPGHLRAQDMGDMGGMGHQAGATAPRPPPDSLRTTTQVRAYLASLPPGEIPDLSGLDLTGWRFERCNLRKADCSGTKLEGSVWQSCRAPFVSFVGANLSEAAFAGGDFNNSVWRRATLTSAKRKQLRKERARAVEGLRIEEVTGGAISPDHWDAMWAFYQDTGARKWGHPYLTRAAFDLMGRRMADRIILVIAYDGAAPVAGAMHFLGSDTLYGRYWGCVRDIPYLHFELCYYRAIDIAIERGLRRVEAGAQGVHKLARGYGPVATWSAHYIADPGFRRAVADFLQRERAAEVQEMEWLEGHMPFRGAE